MKNRKKETRERASGWRRHAHSPVPDTVILIDIRSEDYSFSELNSRWPNQLSEKPCPACLISGQFARHGSYLKYYFASLIQILRVRCLHCGVTHALMPGFSLPGTSVGTVDAETYLVDRAAGIGRGSASKGFRRLGLSTRYPKHLDRMFSTAVSRAKALFPDAADDRLSGIEWIQALAGPNERPLWSLNQFCLARRYNCLCFCRASIIRFTTRSARSRTSHNRGSPAG